MILSKDGIKVIPDSKIKILSKIYEDELRFGKKHKKLNEILKEYLT